MTTPSAGAILVAQSAKTAGFTGKALTDWTALGLAESGGNPNSVNNTPSTGDLSYGLWQINYYGSLGPGRTAEFGPAAGLLDPVKNAKAAYTLSSGGTNYSPWQADFNNGRYYQMLPEAQAAVAAIGGGGAAGTVTSGSSAPAGIASTGTVAQAGDNTQATGTQTCTPVVSLPLVGTILNSCQTRTLIGGLVMAGGVVVMFGGLVVILVATPQLGSTARTVAKAVPGGGLLTRAAGSGDGDRRRYGVGETPLSQRQADRLQAREAADSAGRAAKGSEKNTVRRARAATSPADGSFRLSDGSTY